VVGYLGHMSLSSVNHSGVSASVDAESPFSTLKRRSGFAHRTAVDAVKTVCSKSHLRLPVDI
jgi:hypothetical protein